MRKVKVVVCLCSLLLVLTCHKKTPTEPPQENIHPQVDIPWPSLANSPWPIAHGNVQCTGRSPYQGPRQGVVDWTFSEEGLRIEIGSPVIGEDGTIYFMDNYRLYAINPDGTLKWKFNPGRQLGSTPMIGRGDIIYFGAGGKKGSEGAIYAMNHDGTVRWEYPISAPIFCLSGAIGLDGTIYYIDMGGKLYALNPEGMLKWSAVGSGGFYGGFNSSISIAPDGATLYIVGRDSTVNAINAQSAQIIWQFKTGYILTSGTLVDNDGNIYFYGKKERERFVVSVAATGELRWKSTAKELEYLDHIADMHMDKDGNLYMCNWGDRQVISIDYQGQLRWVKDTTPDFQPPGSPIVGDREGVVYVASNEDYIIAFNQEGSNILNIKVTPYALSIINGAISNERHLYVCSRLKLISIR